MSLTREAIVAAAMLADTEGLGAVSVRRLAATGKFPQLSTVGPPEPTSAAERDRFLTRGLGRLLAGIGASVDPM